jgi:hypothetical protein
MDAKYFILQNTVLLEVCMDKGRIHLAFNEDLLSVHKLGSDGFDPLMSHLLLPSPS